MLRCAAPFVTAAYTKVRLIPQGLRALPMDFLRNRLVFKEIKFMNTLNQNINMAQASPGTANSQAGGQSDAVTASKQMESVFLNELLRIMMEQTSFGQDRTVSVFLPAITSEISKSLAERGIGLGDFFMKNSSKIQSGASNINTDTGSEGLGIKNNMIDRSDLDG
jgi:Rod binding domain-containing protein